jgi:hypothetical protein
MRRKERKRSRFRDIPDRGGTIVARVARGAATDEAAYPVTGAAVSITGKLVVLPAFESNHSNENETWRATLAPSNSRPQC